MHREVLGSVRKIGRYPIKVSDSSWCDLSSRLSSVKTHIANNNFLIAPACICTLRIVKYLIQNSGILIKDAIICILVSFFCGGVSCRVCDAFIRLVIKGSSQRLPNQVNKIEVRTSCTHIHGHSGPVR